MTRPRLLFLSHQLPEPPDSGAAIRTHNVLRVLAQRYDVTALCFWRETSSVTAGTPAERAERLSAYGAVETFATPAAGNRFRAAWDHARSVVRGKPWVWFLYDSRQFMNRLRAFLQKERFSLVHMDSMDLVRYLPILGRVPVVCVHHNVESSLLQRRAEAESPAVVRAYLRHQAKLLRRQEERWCPRVALNVVVSEDDQTQLGSIAPDARFVVFPNGVDVHRYAPTDGPQDGLAFIGGTTWFPNRDALEFFSSQILPNLHRQGDRPSVNWVGHTSDAEVRRFGADGLTLTGYVEDERPWMARAACFVVPLRVGGGTRLKILNAWSMGKAVVSTSLGCEGLEARHGENILIADGPEAFADAVRSVLHDADLRKRLESGARATAVERYSWDVIGRQMLETYESIESEG
ncbi:MAG: glycosyltransferase family 4 protein [Gemmatimonadetes bacterium]|nr:glycosyltransferase family 4 protein [Gemmatimonadota bacterium]